MITEDYVSFETAKLLKEKGFDWEESPFYSEQDRDEWRQNNSYSVPNEEYKPDIPFDTETLTKAAPHISLQMAMKWLREKHNFEIRSIYSNDEKGWWGSVNRMFDITDDNTDVCQRTLLFDCTVKSYEEAAEAAIKYCLEKLINDEAVSKQAQ